MHRHPASLYIGQRGTARDLTEFAERSKASSWQRRGNGRSFRAAFIGTADPRTYSSNGVMPWVGNGDSRPKRMIPTELCGKS
jgi:hypothetical protein